MDEINTLGDRFTLQVETQAKSIIERYGEETDLDDLKYYADILKQYKGNLVDKNEIIDIDPAINLLLDNII